MFGSFVLDERVLIHDLTMHSSVDEAGKYRRPEKGVGAATISGMSSSEFRAKTPGG
jgi:hypothetical protein